MYSEVCSLSSSTLQYPNQSTVINLQIKSNQITFIVTSPQHSALVSEILMSVLQTVQKKKKKKNCTYGQTLQKKQQTIYICTDSAKKKLHWSIYSAPDSAKKPTTIYIWTVHITDCTEDNVQNTHTYTQYT